MRFGDREYKRKEAAAGVNTTYSHAFLRCKGYILFLVCGGLGAQGLLILFPVFGGEKAAAKIQTVKVLRVEIFLRCSRKNTTRLLTGWIVGADEIFHLKGEKAV